jgi:hypothetical protein
MSVAGDDLPAFQSTEVNLKEVLTLLKLTPDFNACSATERRKRKDEASFLSLMRLSRVSAFVSALAVSAHGLPNTV